MLDVIQMPNLAQFLPLLAVGFVTAAIVGWFAIKWLINYLGKHSLYVFAGLLRGDWVSSLSCLRDKNSNSLSEK